MQAVLACSF